MRKYWNFNNIICLLFGHCYGRMVCLYSGGYTRSCKLCNATIIKEWEDWANE